MSDWSLLFGRESAGALPLRGDAGVGKTALLDRIVARPAACRVVRLVGVQSERELAFAARLPRPGRR